jgi:hypothetical protein
LRRKGLLKSLIVLVSSDQNPIRLICHLVFILVKLIGPLHLAEKLKFYEAFGATSAPRLASVALP